jgi:hypothetical protein
MMLSQLYCCRRCHPATGYDKLLPLHDAICYYFALSHNSLLFVVASAMGYWRPRVGRRPLRNECWGALQVDASAGIGLARVVMPQKRNKAAWNRDNWRKKRAVNVSDDKAEPAPLGVERAQRSAKKTETKGQAPSAVKVGRTAIRAGAKAKAIEEIDLEE